MIMMRCMVRNIAEDYDEMNGKNKEEVYDEENGKKYRRRL